MHTIFKIQIYHIINNVLEIFVKITTHHENNAHSMQAVNRIVRNSCKTTTRLVSHGLFVGIIEGIKG